MLLDASATHAAAPIGVAAVADLADARCTPGLPPEAGVMDTDDDHVDPPVGDGLEAGPDRPRLSVTHSPTGARVIGVGATLGATAGAELRREVRALLARSADPLVVDLRAVRAVEPVASAVLRDLAHEAGVADVDLRVVRDRDAPEVARACLGDEALFEIYPTLGAALQRPAGALPPTPGPHPGPPSPGG